MGRKKYQTDRDVIKDLKGAAAMNEDCSRMGLLDTLAALCKCEYLSDLVYTASDQQIKCSLRTISPDDYTMNEWIDTIKYLTRKEFPAFISQFDAAEYLFSIPSYFKATTRNQSN